MEPVAQAHTPTHTPTAMAVGKRGLAISDLLNPTTLLHKKLRYDRSEELTRDQRVGIRALRTYLSLSYRDLIGGH